VANFIYNEFKRALAAGEIDWETATVKVMLVRTGSTAGSERSADNLAAFTTINRYNGSGYADQAVTGRVLQENAGANRVELLAGNTTFPTLNGLTPPNEAIGAVYYVEFSGSDAGRMPAIWFDSSFPFNGSGSDVTLRPNAAGLAQLG
jgi:hypothetical protein